MDLTTILLYVIIAVASTAVYLLRRNLSYWKKLGIPHEVPHTLVGNMKGFRHTQALGNIIADYYRKFKSTGPFAGMFFGQTPVAVLLSTDLIKNVLIKDFTNFTDRGVYSNPKSDPLTGHLFLMNGDKWRTLRNKLSPTFTSGKIKSMYPIFLKMADKMVNVLNETIKKDPILEVRDFLGHFTVDVIASTALGIEANSLTTPDDPFLKMGRMAIERQRHNFIVMHFIDSFPRLARKLGMRVLPEDVHKFFTRTVKDTVEYREKHNIQRNDFLNMLMELKNDKSIMGGLTIEEVAAQVLVFFQASFETTSSTMAFALHELAQNQEMQDRLREEVNEVFEKHGKSEFPYEAISNIPYLDQVLWETMRKYPVIPVLNRQALNDYVVPGHPKYVLKKGLPLFIPVLGIHYDPEFYPNPEEFDPERFAPEVFKERDSMAWLPFGDGPRNCIGLRFGKLKARLGLATIIRHFRFSVCPKTVIPITLDPKPAGLVPKEKMYLKVEAI